MSDTKDRIAVAGTPDIFTSEARAVFAAFADQLMPPDGSMPAPSALDVQGEGLDRLFPLRPELASPIREAIGWALRSMAEGGAADVFALEREYPELFAAVATGAAGIYLTEDIVKKRLGYPGRPALDVGDMDGQARELYEMTAKVRDRGDVWKHTPQQFAPERAE